MLGSNVYASGTLLVSQMDLTHLHKKKYPPTTYHHPNNHTKLARKKNATVKFTEKLKGRQIL